MKDRTIVIALGGNALIKKGETGDIHQQFSNTRDSLNGVIQLIKNKNKVILTHGNGPVVGNILIRVDQGAKLGVPKMPLGICVADSQGGIGYMLQQSLQNKLKENNIYKCVATIITQVLIDKNDPCVKNPTKYVGPFYTEEQLNEIKSQNPDWTIKEDSGRGYRRVVPSPFPLDIVEKRSIKKIIEDGFLVIAAGGGGIPVYYDENGNIEGFDAVIDKDLTAYVMARETNADTLIILTNEDGVYLDYNTDKQRMLSDVTLAEIKKYFDAGQFPPGSMGPKIKAAMLFLEEGKENDSIAKENSGQNGQKQVLITSIEKFQDALDGKTGTVIRN